MILVLLAAFVAGVLSQTNIFDNDIASLAWQIRGDQWNNSVPCVFPIQFGHEKGKFANDVHFNFVGGPAMQSLRSFGVPDDNMFVTSFVLEAIFEAMLLAGDVAPPNDSSVAAAIEAILTVKDKNSPNDVPVFCFWPQQYLNSSNVSAGSSWEQWPDNLANACAQGVDLDELLKVLLTDMGLGNLWPTFGPQLADYLKGLEVLFQIPPDSDDTSVVLALQHYLKKVQKLVPSAFEVWNNTGFAPSKAFKTILKYSYCPAHDDIDKNTIDPRTYFWSHEYFNNVSDPQECFVATWLQNITFSTQVALNRTAGPQMPLNVNNVDPTVCSNALYAMSSNLLYGDEGTDWFSTNPQMVKLYLSTANFVHYALSTQPWQQRPDLEMLYYPPQYDLVYFVARHVRMLQSFLDLQNVTTFPLPEIGIVFSTLKAAVRGGGMTFIKQKMNSSCWNDNSSDVCWDGFLGLADLNELNESTPHYQDRFFSTGVVLNAVLDTWTTTTNFGTHIQWLPDTPVSMIDLAKNAGMYLHHALQDNTTSYENAFFSGSGKYWEQYQFWYPANVRYDMRSGNIVNCSNVTISEIKNNYYFWVFGASGSMDENTFDQLAIEGCGGIPAPTWFTGYNGERAFQKGADGHAWPFWSAPVMSRAQALQGLSKLRNL